MRSYDPADDDDVKTATEMGAEPWDRLTDAELADVLEYLAKESAAVEGLCPPDLDRLAATLRDALAEVDRRRGATPAPSA